MLNWLIAISGFAFFAAIHSLLASHTFKKKVFTRYPKVSVWYRLGYNIVSLVILSVWALFLPVSHRIIYRIPFPFFIITFLIQTVALLTAWRTVRLFGSGRFLGTEQLIRYFKNQEIPKYYDENTRGTFNQKGLYKYVRHPLYTLSLIFLICWPVMSTWFLMIIILCALYFWIGSIYEERKLIDRFGDTYEEYRKQVPRMIPRFSRLLTTNRKVQPNDRTFKDISR